RHTRSYGDWSSDVCSSDLLRLLVDGAALAVKAVAGAAVEERKGQHQLRLPARLRNGGDGRRIGVVERLHDGREERQVVRPEVARSEERRVGKEGRGGGSRD